MRIWKSEQTVMSALKGIRTLTFTPFKDVVPLPIGLRGQLPFGNVLLLSRYAINYNSINLSCRIGISRFSSCGC